MASCIDYLQINIFQVVARVQKCLGNDEEKLLLDTTKKWRGKRPDAAKLNFQISVLASKLDATDVA